MKPCSCCGEMKPIVYFDYAYGNSNPYIEAISIRVCYSCLIKVGWKKEAVAILPKLITCVQCNNKFIPKNHSQIKCSVCLAKYFSKNKVIEKNREVMQCKLPS